MAAMLGSSFFGTSITFSPGTMPSFAPGLPMRDLGPPFSATSPSFGPVPPFAGAPIVPPFDTLTPAPSGFGPQAAPLVTLPFLGEDTLVIQRQSGEPPPVISVAPGDTVITFADGDAIHLLGVGDGVVPGGDVIL